MRREDFLFGVAEWSATHPRRTPKRGTHRIYLYTPSPTLQTPDQERGPVAGFPNVWWVLIFQGEKQILQQGTGRSPREFSGPSASRGARSSSCAGYPRMTIPAAGPREISVALLEEQSTSPTSLPAASRSKRPRGACWRPRRARR